MSLDALFNAARTSVEKVVFGQDEPIEFALAALFSSGHVLLEGPPGTAKTLLVRAIAASLRMDYRRIQMTPDLLPGDITGSSIYRENTGTFEFMRGPVFTNFLLADEVNRASARTQSAMLEAMQELAVTHDGVTHPLPSPFIAFATQNPIEQEGTYPLPLAQLDRFMFKVIVGYPDPKAEERVLREHHATGAVTGPQALGLVPVIEGADIHNARETIRQTHVREEMIGYVRRLIEATRRDDSLSVGASPRAGLMLLMGSKSLARFAGRDFVTPDDVKRAFLPALRHRVVLSPHSELEGTRPDDVLASILDRSAAMTFRPGPNLLRLAGSAVILAALSIFLPLAAWLVLPVAIAAGALALYDRLWLRRHQAQLSVSRVLPQVGGRDVPFDVVLRVSGKGATPFGGTLREVAPAEAAPRWWIADFRREKIAGSAEFRKEFRIATRGRFEFGPAWVCLVGPCGVLEGLWETGGRNSIKIFPEGIVAKDDLSQHVAAEVQILDRRSRTRRRNVGTEFESINEFRLGDDPRRIDWRATARMRRLVVRRFQVEQHQDVVLLIDCGRLMGAAAGRGSKLDCAVDAALLLARVALANGDRCGVGLFDSRVTGFLPPRSSLAAFPTIIECLYAAQSRWQETDFASMFAHIKARQTKRAVIVVLSDVGDEETSRRACVALSGLAARHVVIFAALQTPLFLRQAQSPLEDQLDAARQAVAYRLLRERERTLHSLRRANVQVLDVDPAELTIPLVNRYLDLRARNVV